jgi:hypothetical protein
MTSIREQVASLRSCPSLQLHAALVEDRITVAVPLATASFRGAHTPALTRPLSSICVCVARVSCRSLVIVLLNKRNMPPDFIVDVEAPPKFNVLRRLVDWKPGPDALLAAVLELRHAVLISQVERARVRLRVSGAVVGRATRARAALAAQDHELKEAFETIVVRMAVSAPSVRTRSSCRRSVCVCTYGICAGGRGVCL